jgi:hypothetical protein
VDSTREPWEDTEARERLKAEHNDNEYMAELRRRYTDEAQPPVIELHSNTGESVGPASNDSLRSEE